MKSKFASVFFLLMSAGSLALQSCEKTGIINDAHPGTSDSTFATGLSSKSTGGGGTSGGGHNGGGGVTVTPSSPSLAPTDTTTSLLPVGDIITTGQWKLTSFVQGNDNLASQFASYIFTFNTDGSMVADDNGSQTTGLWHYQDAVFYYGIPIYGSSPYGFTMTIGTSLPLTSLNENYFISKKTLTTIYIDSINPNENAHITLSKLAQ
ncbi:MAG: hypothetical protein ACJ75B_22055 [Flavisolibacter sp.]